MPATVIAERMDWPRGITVLKRAAWLRCARRTLPVGPLPTHRVPPGRARQWDLSFPAVDIPVAADEARRFRAGRRLGPLEVLAARMVASVLPMTCWAATWPA